MTPVKKVAGKPGGKVGSPAPGSPSKAMSEAKDKSKKGAKGSIKGGKGKKYCRGCGLYFDMSLFQVNEPYCPTDSNAMKRLGRAATAQKKNGPV